MFWAWSPGRKVCMSPRLAPVPLVVLLNCTTLLAPHEEPAARPIERVQSPVDQLLDALRAPVPPVVIHEVIFNTNKAARILAIDAVNEAGEVLDAAPELEALGPGVVIGSDMRADTLDTGDRVHVGDVLLKVVLGNTGTARVRLTVGPGWTRTLAPEQRLYVGSEEALVGPCREGSAAAVTSQVRGGRTHCAVCECSCVYDGGSCIARIESSRASGCGVVSNEGCVCDTEDGERTGALTDCGRVYVACGPN